MSKKIQKQARAWVFTWNNYPDGTCEKLKKLCLESGVFSYLIFGREIGELKGTPHLQAYFELPRKRGPKALAKTLGIKGAWLEPAYAGSATCILYCKKGAQSHAEWVKLKTHGPSYGVKADWEEYGTLMHAGKRTDIDAVKRDIEAGMSELELYKKHMSQMLRFGNGYMNYKRLCAPPRDTYTSIILILGDSRVGKTRMARILYNSGMFGDGLYVVPEAKSILYFDGYDGQEVVLLDEMDGSRMKPTMLNNLTDRYEYSIPVHGKANVQFVAKTIIIISNYSYEHWWADSKAYLPFEERLREWGCRFVIPNSRFTATPGWEPTKDTYIRLPPRKRDVNEVLMHPFKTILSSPNHKCNDRTCSECNPNAWIPNWMDCNE